MILLDGVIQAPGGSNEDESDNFIYGGWTAQYSDDVYGNGFKMNSSNLLTIFWAEKHLRYGRTIGLIMQTFR